MKKTPDPLPAKVLLTPFEKATIAIVEYLVDHWNLHKKFRRKNELLAQLGLKLNNYWEYKKAQRNIPKEHWHKIYDVLVNQYNANPPYMHSAQGDMFLNAKWLVEEPKVPYGIDELRSKYLILQKENEKLRNQVATLEKENKLQAKLISQLETRQQSRQDNKKS